MEKLVVTRCKGGSFESRSLQACPLQPRHASQGKKSNRRSVGVPLERRGERSAAPAQRCNRHNQTIPHRSGGQQGSGPAALPSQREQTTPEPKPNYVWATRQPLSGSRITAFVEICAQNKQVVYQELDRSELAWSFSLQYEDHANSRVARPNPTPGWNQAEDQECSLRDLLAWSPLGIGRTQSRLRPRRESRPSRCFDRCSAKQQSFNPTCGFSSRGRSSNLGATATPRSNDGARRCGHGSSRIGVDRTEVEERRMEDRNPSVRIRIGRRRTEGNQEQEQSPATWGAGSTGTSSLAGKHGLSIGRGLDFCQSALSRQDSIHLSNSLPAAHSSRDRESRWNKEQQSSTDRMAHPAPFASDIADLKRGECEGCAIATSSHNPKDHPGPLRTSGFSRSAGSPQEGRTNGASGAISGALAGEKRYRNCVENGTSIVLGVRGCPKSTLPKSAKCFKVLVSAAGFEPATHALKGRCSTT